MKQCYQYGFYLASVMLPSVLGLFRAYENIQMLSSSCKIQQKAKRLQHFCWTLRLRLSAVIQGKQKSFCLVVHKVSHVWSLNQLPRTYLAWEPWRRFVWAKPCLDVGWLGLSLVIQEHSASQVCESLSVSLWDGYSPGLVDSVSVSLTFHPCLADQHH